MAQQIRTPADGGIQQGRAAKALPGNGMTNMGESMGFLGI